VRLGACLFFFPPSNQGPVRKDPCFLFCFFFVAGLFEFRPSPWPTVGWVNTPGPERGLPRFINLFKNPPDPLCFVFVFFFCPHCLVLLPPFLPCSLACAVYFFFPGFPPFFFLSGPCCTPKQYFFSFWFRRIGPCHAQPSSDSLLFRLGNTLPCDWPSAPCLGSYFFYFTPAGQFLPPPLFLDASYCFLCAQVFPPCLLLPFVPVVPPHGCLKVFSFPAPQHFFWKGLPWLTNLCA